MNASVTRRTSWQRCGSREMRRPGWASTKPRSTTCGRPKTGTSIGISLERTRVLIASEQRALGNLRGAERLLSLVLLTKNEPTRADALSERARLRELQRRDAEALADLREADSIYARLGLDFNRIDSSSALAMALLAAGDVRSASRSADTAVAIETRIRASSGNPEVRARFLSASYAPYEARIEADLARAAPRDNSAIWEAFRVAEAIRGRSLADRLAYVRNIDASSRPCRRHCRRIPRCWPTSWAIAARTAGC